MTPSCRSYARARHAASAGVALVGLLDMMAAADPCTATPNGEEQAPPRPEPTHAHHELARVDIYEIAEPLPEITRAELAIVTSNPVEHPRATLLVCPGQNGDGAHFLNDGGWVEFAERHQLAVAALRFESPDELLCHDRGYFRADRGSGDLVISGLEALGYPADRMPLQREPPPGPERAIAHSPGFQTPGNPTPPHRVLKGRRHPCPPMPSVSPSCSYLPPASAGHGRAIFAPPLEREPPPGPERAIAQSPGFQTLGSPTPPHRVLKGRRHPCPPMPSADGVLIYSIIDRYADERNLAVNTFKTATLWRSRRSHESLNFQECLNHDRIVDRVAGAWDRGIRGLCREQKAGSRLSTTVLGLAVVMRAMRERPASDPPCCPPHDCCESEECRRVGEKITSATATPLETTTSAAKITASLGRLEISIPRTSRPGTRYRGRPSASG